MNMSFGRTSCGYRSARGRNSAFGCLSVMITDVFGGNFESKFGVSIVHAEKVEKVIPVLLVKESLVTESPCSVVEVRL